MASQLSLTLERWRRELGPLPHRARPGGRVARIMTYFLACARGYASRKTLLDYLRTMEPEVIGALYHAAAQVPHQDRRAYVQREVALLGRRLRRAVSVCRRRWRFPIVCVPGEGYYVDLPDAAEPADEAAQAIKAVPPAQRELARCLAAEIEALEKQILALTDTPQPTLGHSASSELARLRWGCTPVCYGSPAQVQPLRNRQTRLLAQLRSLPQPQSADRRS